MNVDHVAVAFGLVVAIVAIAGTFAFISVIVYAESKRKEREALYRSEVHRALLEREGGSAEKLLAVIAAEEAGRAAQDRVRMRVRGLVTAVTGAAMLVLSTGGGDWEMWRIGLIPLCAGIGFLLFGLLPGRRTSSSSPPRSDA
jgi:hypothetical protein